MSAARQTAHPHPAKRAKMGERTMLACTNCKQRKLKCDGQSPKCSNCTKSDRDCLVEDPATGLHRPRDYVQSLEARVAYLEGLLQESRPEASGDTPNSDLSDVRSTEPHESDLLSNEVALLCLGAAGREPQYFGPSSAVHFSRIVGSTLRLPRRGGTGSHYSNASDSATRRTARYLGFPDTATMAKLSEAYFSNIHPQYPFLHQPTFRAMEQECLEASLRNNINAASESSLFFVLMVRHFLSCFITPSKQTPQGYYAMALNYIAHLLDMDNLLSIQAMLCCAVYSVRSQAGVSLWKISGMAMRHCVELGYHRSTERYRNSVDTLTKEISKRCFWVAYDIDLVASFILGRPAGISDSAIDVELPLDIDDEYITRDGLLCPPRQNTSDPPTQLTGALHSIKLRQLWSKFRNNLFSTNSHQENDSSRNPNRIPVEVLRQELEEWRAISPDKLENIHLRPLSVFASDDWFGLAYHYSILLLYRHYIIDSPEPAAQGSDPLAQEDNEPDARDRAFEICATHARQMCLGYRRLYQSQRSQIQFTWGSLHILFLGGLTYLYCLWKSPYIRKRTRQSAVINTCMACTTVLIIIAERWNEACSYRDIFELLSESTITMICGNGGDAVSGESVELATLTTLMGGGDTSTGTHPSGGGLVGNASGGGNMYDASTATDGCGATEQIGGPDMPLQDWIMALDHVTASGDSQWLAQELLQGIRDFEAETNINSLN
ncbi:conserved hypothetical protein [Talaromyces marneffei ATCC 18224]|uniref:Zn(2)-C6 fungal-type domain-containing protein n=1 Tax=Talaromyces marneffei (strain ATCC 18224 / CBS 334.59 / QM 7333) TaxID=441960 RepID=B6QVK2_TALMQ|nr:conserved hypothetical protein [Talaromyces marneffei ATCC 18224]